MMDHPKPLDGKVFPRFSGIKTFFRLPYFDLEKLDTLKTPQNTVGLLGVPFDGGTSYRSGGRFAPEAIRSISSLGRGYHADQSKSIFDRLCVYDMGDIPVVPQNIHQTHENIYFSVQKLLQSSITPVLVGGDHSISIGSLKAMFEQYGPLSIVHFDAHSDTYPPAWGCNEHHGTFMRLGHERGWFQKNQVIQIGIRPPFSGPNDFQTPLDYGFQVFGVEDVQYRLETVTKAIESLKGPVYVTFDVDCLDPAFAPGTGTPVPGGLTSFQALTLLRSLYKLSLVGADVVEVCPPYDPSHITSLMALSILFELLSALAYSKGQLRSHAK